MSGRLSQFVLEGQSMRLLTQSMRERVQRAYFTRVQRMFIWCGQQLFGCALIYTPFGEEVHGISFAIHDEALHAMYRDVAAEWDAEEKAGSEEQSA